MWLGLQFDLYVIFKVFLFLKLSVKFNKFKSLFLDKVFSLLLFSKIIFSTSSLNCSIYFVISIFALIASEFNPSNSRQFAENN